MQPDSRMKFLKAQGLLLGLLFMLPILAHFIAPRPTRPGGRYDVMAQAVWWLLPVYFAASAVLMVAFARQKHAMPPSAIPVPWRGWKRATMFFTMCALAGCAFPFLLKAIVDLKNP